MFVVKGLKKVVMMMVKCLLELPEKDVVGNLELVYDGFGIGGEDATGDGGGLRPSVDRERSFEKGRMKIEKGRMKIEKDRRTVVCDCVLPISRVAVLM